MHEILSHRASSFGLDLYLTELKACRFLQIYQITNMDPEERNDIMIFQVQYVLEQCYMKPCEVIIFSFQVGGGRSSWVFSLP